MIERRYTRHQRRHAHFVLESADGYLVFAPDGVNDGFTELSKAHAFDYAKANILKQAVKKFELHVKMVTRLNGKLTAL